VRHQVDAAGRLLAVQQPDGAVERFAYDAQGRLIAHRDALGHETHWRLNPLGRPLERLDALGQPAAARANRQRPVAHLRARARQLHSDAAHRR